MKSKIFIVGVIVLLTILVILGVYYAIKWKPLLTPAVPLPIYPIDYHRDDTLKIIMIGDSWAMLQAETVADSSMAVAFEKETRKPVRFHSRGRGGAKSKEIYYSMFRDKCEEPAYSTQDLIEIGPDYCIVIAGINDANANMGSSYYCTNYLLIVRHLLTLGIRPVIIEIPDVYLHHVHAKKSVRYKLLDIYRAFLTGAPMHNIKTYRADWLDMLKDKRLIDSIIYIKRNNWNPEGYENLMLYRKDLFHLSDKGYYKLDSCIISEIAKDYLSRLKVKL